MTDRQLIETTIEQLLGYPAERKEQFLRKVLELDARIRQMARPPLANPDSSLQLTVDELVREALSIRHEQSNPTVLLSDPDPPRTEQYIKLLRSQRIGVINCSEAASLFQYFSSRKSKNFYLAGILYASEVGSPATAGVQDMHTSSVSNGVAHSKQRSIAIYENLPYLLAPCFVFIDESKDLTVIRKNASIFPSGLIPRPYQVIERIHDQVRGLRRDFSGSDRVYSIGFLEENLERIRAQSDTVALRQGISEVAKRYSRDPDFWDRAIDAYHQLHELDPTDGEAIHGLVDLLLRRKMRESHLNSFTYEHKTGLEAVISLLEKTSFDVEISERDFLLGKAYVLQRLEKATPPAAANDLPESSKPSLSAAAGLLLRHLQKQPRDFDALAYLALEYVFLGTPRELETAHQLITLSIRGSDVLTQSLTPGSKFETDILTDSMQVSGSRVLQPGGLHRVFDLDAFVAKSFEPPPPPGHSFRYEAVSDIHRAEIEVKNIIGLNALKDELFITIDGARVPLHIPPWASLVRSSTLTDSYVFEIMPFLTGVTLADEFARIDDLGDVSLGRLRDDLKIKHLEWVVDATAQLQVTGLKLEHIKDARNAKYVVQMGSGQLLKAGYYASRADKLIDTLERYPFLGHEPICVPDPVRKKLLSGFQQLEDRVLKTPEPFWVFFTDSNLTNLLISVHPRSISHPLESVIHRARVDFETSNVMLGFSDILIALDHPLSKMHAPENANATHYLLHRWMSDIIVNRGPDSQRRSNRQAYDSFVAQISGFTALDWHERYDLERPLVRKYLSQTYGLSGTQLNSIISSERVHRHLSMASSRSREAMVVRKTCAEFETKYSELTHDTEIGTYTQKLRALEKLPTSSRGTEYLVHYAYARLKSHLESLVYQQKHHLSLFREGLGRANIPRLKQAIHESCRYILYKT